MEAKDARGLRIGDSRVLAWWGAAARGDISAEGSSDEARLVIWIRESGRETQKAVYP